MWLDPRHKEKRENNKLNCGKVKCHQWTGSRSYHAHFHALLMLEKYNDIPPNAIDLFKEYHCSKKRGFSDAVKLLGIGTGVTYCSSCSSFTKIDISPERWHRVWLKRAKSF